MQNKLLSTVLMFTKFIFYGLLCQVFMLTMLFAHGSEAQKYQSVKEKRVNLELRNVSLKKAFSELEKKTGYLFTYDDSSLNKKVKIDLIGEDKLVYDYLMELSKNGNLYFKQFNNSISVFRQDSDQPEKVIQVVEEVAAIEIKGSVKDENGESLPGVNVLIQGTSQGAITDFNGNFTIQANEGDVLVFSFIGYIKQEVTVGSQSLLNVVLYEDTQQLQEVVVIGYGQTTVKDATGAVAAITSEDFNTGVIASPEQLIQGKTAGVQITQTSGAPGAGIELRIRGTNSVRSNNNPLFVVDGVPLGGEETSAGGPNVGFGTSGSSNPLNFLNPSDIESISILKDASSAAIYGSRAANGVVFITTKKGRGEGVFEFSSSASLSSAARKYDLLKVKEAPYFLSGVGQYGGDVKAQDFGNDTDWQDYITRTSISHKQNLSYSKGFENGTIRGSFGYDNQQGVIENSGLERITGRINGTRSMMNDQLNLSLQTTFSRVNEESAPIGGSAGFRGDLLGAAYSANPTWPTDPTFDTGGQLSPANMLANFRSTAFTNRLLVNFSADYKISEDLSAKFTYGFDKSNSERVALSSPDALYFDRGTTGNGRSGYGEINTLNNLMEVTATYNKEFGNSKLEAVVGTSYQDFGREGLNAEGYGFATSDFAQMEADFVGGIEALNNAAKSVGGFYQQFGLSEDLRNGAQSDGFFVNSLIPEVSTTFLSTPSGVNVRSISADRFDTTDKLQSYFGRFNYTYANKYLMTFTIRADGSSRFGDNEKWGIFPSGALAWKIHEEAFLPDMFSTLKLRLGGGIVGNQDGLGYGGFVRRERYNKIEIGDGGEISIPGTSSVALLNPNLKWEETQQYNVGIDFGIAGERFYGSLDYYRKETTDLILRLNAAQPAPNPFIFQNFDATVINKGWEVALNYDIIDSDDVSFTVSYNFSRNDNEIQDFSGQIPAGTIRGQGLSQAYSQILAEGQPLFSYYLREFVGFDANGQPIRDNQTFVGKSALPTYNSGLSLNLKHGNWDFSTYFTGQFGHHVYNNTRNAFFTAGAINNARNVTVDVLTSGEAGSAEAAVSERFLESGDFIRMQNLSIGYNIPVGDNNMFNNLRVYANAQNLFLITDYSGLDPEVSTQPAKADLLNELPTAGIDYTAYPRPRVFTIGLNATF